MIILTVIAAVVAAYWLLMLVTHSAGLRRLPKLPRAGEPTDAEPVVSVIIPARNEEEAIGRTTTCNWASGSSARDCASAT